MKKMFMMLCALALPACVLFTACDDDDDPTPLAKTVEGTYPVEIGVTLVVGEKENPLPAADASVVVAAATDNTVNLALDGFKFMTQEIPISLTDIAISGSEGNATLAYSGAITTEVPLGSLTGTLNGTIKDGVMDVQLNIEQRSEPEDPEPSMIIKVSLNSK